MSMPNFNVFQLPSGYSWGNYQIINKIGQGGMGVIYKAIQLDLNREVAIKIINPSLISNKSNSFLRRFEREISIAAEFNHSYIGRVYTYEKYENLLCLVMEYIPGIPLHEYLKQNTLSLDQKLLLFQKICEAMEYTHSKNIIHRDLKPQNILVTIDAQPKIIDFGLARRSINKNHSLTKTGEVIGTYHYMAPEQFTGKNRFVDEQSDIYSLGAIFYEILTGKLMRSGTTAKQLFECKIVPLKDFDQTIDKNIEKIWQMMIVTNRKDRYSNISELLKDLSIVTSGNSISTRLSRKYYYRLISIITLFLLFISGFLHIITNSSPHQTIVLELPETEKQILTLIDKGEHFKAISLYDDYNVKANDLLAKAIIESYNSIRKLGIETLSTQPINARKCFEIVDKAFSDDAENLGYLAKTFLPMSSYAETFENASDTDLNLAEKHLKKSLQLDPYNSNFFLLLAKIDFSRKNYQQTVINLQNAISLNNTNLEALEMLSKIPYFEPKLQQECYQYIVGLLNTLDELPEPQLFVDEIYHLEKKYQNDYLQYLSFSKWTKQQQQNWQEITNNIEKYSLNNRLHDTLLSFRYLPEYKPTLATIIKEHSHNLELINFLQNNLQQVDSLIKQETRKYCYYQIAHMYHYQNWQNIKLRYLEFQTQLQNIIESEVTDDENAMLIFLATKCYVERYDFIFLLELLNNKNLHILNKTIVSAVLKKYFLSIDSEIFYEYAEHTTGTSFIDYLVANCMYNYDPKFYIDTQSKEREIKKNEGIFISSKEIQLLSNLANSSNGKVRISALMNLLSLLNIDIQKQKTQEILAKIKNEMNHSMPIIRAYIHHYFWKNQNVRQMEQKQRIYYYEKALIDNNFVVQKYALANYIDVLDLLNVEEIIQVIQEIPNNKRDLSSEQQNILRLYVVGAISHSEKVTFDELMSYLSKQECSMFEKMCASVFKVYNSIEDGQYYNQQVLQTVTAFWNNTIFNKNHYIQSFNLYFLALMGYHLVHIPELQEPQVITNMLYQLYYEANTEKSGMWEMLFPKTGQQQRIKFAEKYIAKEYQGQPIFEYALSGYISLISNEQRDEITKKYKDSDIKTKKAIALGFYYSLHRAKLSKQRNHINRILKADPLSLYKDSIDLLRSFIQSSSQNQIETYIQWLNQAHDFDPDESKYIFELGIFAMEAREYEKALTYFNKAIAKESYYFYYLYAAKILHLLGKNDEAIESLNIVEKMMPEYFIYRETSLMYLLLQKYEKAASLYHKIFLKKPLEYSNLHLGLAESYLGMGKENLAEKMFFFVDNIFQRKEHKVQNFSKKNYKMKFESKLYPLLSEKFK